MDRSAAEICVCRPDLEDGDGDEDGTSLRNVHLALERRGQVGQDERLV